MSLRTYPNITHPAYLRHIEQDRANQHALDAVPVDRLPTSPPKIDNVYEISDYLSVSADIIRSILIFNAKHYRHFQIKKKSGGYRQVDAPRTFLKVVQWWINDVVLSRIPISNQCHGFVKGRSFVTNAFEHVGCNSLLNIDIKDFFPSIGINQVEAVFKEVGYSSTVCEDLSRIVTYKGKLPQGAPSSPAIANLVMRDVDSELFEFCQSHNLKYTRYADDLSISSSEFIPQSVIKYIYRILLEADFVPNLKKTRIMGPNRPKEVTGIALTSDGIGLSRHRLNNLRAKFHNAQVRPLDYSHRRGEITGDVTFVRQIGGRGSERVIELGDLAVSSIEKATRGLTGRR